MEAWEIALGLQGLWAAFIVRQKWIQSNDPAIQSSALLPENYIPPKARSLGRAEVVRSKGLLPWFDIVEYKEDASDIDFDALQSYLNAVDEIEDLEYFEDEYIQIVDIYRWPEEDVQSPKKLPRLMARQLGQLNPSSIGVFPRSHYIGGVTYVQNNSPVLPLPKHSQLLPFLDQSTNKWIVPVILSMSIQPHDTLVTYFGLNNTRYHITWGLVYQLTGPPDAYQYMDRWLLRDWIDIENPTANATPFILTSSMFKTLLHKPLIVDGDIRVFIDEDFSALTAKHEYQYLIEFTRIVMSPELWQQIKRKKADLNGV